MDSQTIKCLLICDADNIYVLPNCKLYDNQERRVTSFPNPFPIKEWGDVLLNKDEALLALSLWVEKELPLDLISEERNLNVLSPFSLTKDLSLEEDWSVTVNTYLRLNKLQAETKKEMRGIFNQTAFNLLSKIWSLVERLKIPNYG